MDLSHAQLKMFSDLAREKNFSKVARLHHLTQPSISARLKQLEETLGLKLFERVPRKVVLTKEGELLLPYVEDLLLRCENLQQVVAKAREDTVGDVRLAATYSLGMYELAPSLRTFIANHPNVHLHVQYRGSAIIYDLILKNKADIGLVPFPKQRANISVIPCGQDEMVLVVPPAHALAQRKRVSLQKLKGERLITFTEGMPTREAIDEVLASHGISMDIQLADENIDTLKRTVEAGMGVSILPRAAIEEERKKKLLCAVSFSNVKITRPLGLITLRDRVLSYPAQLFIEMLAENQDQRKTA